MLVRARKGEFSLDGKYEQVHWLVWRMPVARQAKHGTCVRERENGILKPQAQLRVSAQPDSAAVAVHFPPIKLSTEAPSGLADFMGRPGAPTLLEPNILSDRSSLVGCALRTLGVDRPFPGTSLELRKAVWSSQLPSHTNPIQYYGIDPDILGKFGITSLL
jgi:hypothetical protein